MNWLLLSRHVGLLGMLVGGAMMFSLPWAFPVFGQTEEFESQGFYGILGAMACSLAVGGVLYNLGRIEKGTLLRKEALAIVGLGWMLAGVLGSLPYLFSGTMRADGIAMSIPDALFESISGFTTTGASVLTQLEAPTSTSENLTKLVPRCVLFWRSFTHWLGGMGIIVLFVAILGQLGAGGKLLMRREVPGPITETVRPRVRDTAIVMWVIYMVISVALAAILMVEGLSLYDALCHSFGTMATGGFSTYNASVGHFQNPIVEITIIVFMVAAGTNFSLYYLVINRDDRRKKRTLLQRIRPLIADPEFRLYLGILAVTTLVLSGNLLWRQHVDSIASALRHGSFIAVSIMTTTGFGTEDFTEWGEFAKGLIFLLMFVGGSAGSTGGGIKVVRFLLFAKIIRLEIERAFRPNVVRPLRISGVNLDSSLKQEVLIYFGFIGVVFVFSWILLMAIEPSTQWADSTEHTEAEMIIDCASAVASSLNNIGPGLGVLGPHDNYSNFAPQSKLLLALLMLLGRLELFAILVLFVPSFWRSQ